MSESITLGGWVRTMDNMFEPIIHRLANGRTLTIREPRKEDGRRIHAYIERVAGETDFLTFGPGDSGVTVSEREKQMVDLTNSPNEIALMAEIDGEIAGFLTFTSQKKPRARHRGVFGVTVSREFWGSGIGKSLIRAMIQWARSTSIIRKINLMVRADNIRAIEMYKKLGFVYEGTTTRDLLISDTFYDAVLMGMEIDKKRSE